MADEERKKKLLPPPDDEPESAADAEKAPRKKTLPPPPEEEPEALEVSEESGALEVPEEEKEADEAVDVEPEAEEGGYKVKAKPELDPETRSLLSVRRRIAKKRPRFRRQEWFRYKRLGEKWRKPQGEHSKMRVGRRYRPNIVSIGYRGPVKVRGLHPSGFIEVLVYTPKDVDGLDPKTQAVRIAGGVGLRKRAKIEEAADDRGLRVLNRSVTK